MNSFRIQVAITPSDFGLEKLAAELVALETSELRNRTAKKILHDYCANRVSVRPVPVTTHNCSIHETIKLAFRISARDIGMESLLTDLQLLSNNSERNRHTKRLLYLQYGGLSKPVHDLLTPTASSVTDQKVLKPAATSLSLPPVKIVTNETSEPPNAVHDKRKAAYKRLSAQFE